MAHAIVALPACLDYSIEKKSCIFFIAKVGLINKEGIELQNVKQPSPPSPHALNP